MATVVRKKFRETPAPANYVAGLGRGATGFTTRSDIGPARAAPEPEFGKPPAGYVPGAGRGAAPLGAADPTPTLQPPTTVVPKPIDDDDKDDYSESNYNEFSGYGGSIWTSADPYEKDDMEADEAWALVDKRAEERRRKRKEEKLRIMMEEFRATTPKIQQQFADLKKELSSVTAEEWHNLPEIGNHTMKYKKTRPDRYTPVPDSIVLEGATASDHLNAIDTHSGQATPITDLTQIGAARKTVVDRKLRQVSDSVTGQTVVDTEGYLTDLNSIKVNSDAQIGDIKKARLLLKSVITTNPSHPPGWIAAARLEEVAGRIIAARKVIAKGCIACPKSADVWLESARLQTPTNAKAILAKAVRQIPQSVKIWLQAAEYESEIQSRRLVLRKALEYIPNSVKLWKAAVELENPENAKILLSRAVECVPQHVEIWLALAKLENYENAQKVLNKARTTIPTDPTIWITAAKLEEANENFAGVTKIIKNALISLVSHQVVLERDKWLFEAQIAEQSGFIFSCQAIINSTISLGLDKLDRKSILMEDADLCVKQGFIETARTIYKYALNFYGNKKSIWLRYAFLEKNFGKKEDLDELLKNSVIYCPQAEILWLMAAKEKWLNKDVDSARTILTEAFRANPDSERIWLAAVKLERENDEFDRAAELLVRARERADTEKVWLKSAKLEKMLNNNSQAIFLLDSALKKYPQSDKLWLLRCLLEENNSNDNNNVGIEKARLLYQRALSNCPHSIPLWIAAGKLEGKLGTAKIRSLMEKARLKNPKTAELWLFAIELEEKVSSSGIVANMMAKALQECPNSGLLWAKAISIELKPKQKAKSVDALKRCDNDPFVLIAVARLFWEERKVDKAREWFNRAIALDTDNGDHWAWFYKFELQYGTPDHQRKLADQCVKSSPRGGKVWRAVMKEGKNYKLGTLDILKTVSALVQDRYFKS